MTSRAHPGLVLGDSRQEAQALAYLQRRLAVFYGATVALAAVLYAAAIVLTLMAGEGLGPALREPARLVHLGALLAAVAILALLRRRSFPAPLLVFFDALGLYVAVGAGITIYVLDYERAPHLMTAVLGLFLIARAIAVPSAPKTTFLLSLPAPLGVLAVQLAHGTAWAQEGTELAADYFGRYVVWHQVVLFLAVGVATLASRVGSGLRLQLREAMRLGQYQLEERLGAGAMGEVYRAHHAMLRRPTAVKVIWPDPTDPELLERFEREVRETARLTHPNTVAIFDYGRTPEGAFYYAMEYLDGQDVGRLVEKTGPMPPARAIHVLRQACGALAEAHEAGLVHRDIKAGNIMLCRRGGAHDVVKVVDFGLVKDLHAKGAALTQVGQICGTPETIAPEVLGAGTVTPAADLYALGVVGYYLLTGRHIFDAQSAAEVIGHHLHSPPVPLRERRPDVPPDLERVVLRCLAKRPEERPASAGELAEALRGCRDAGGWTETSAAAWWKSLEAA